MHQREKPPIRSRLASEGDLLPEIDDPVAQAGIVSLLKAYESLSRLKENDRGKNKIGENNQYNDESLVGDIECEKAVIETLQNFASNRGESVNIFSEEHAPEYPDNPSYTAVLDGIDGSKWYTEDRPGYGTLLGINDGDNPKYGDYLFSGIMDHAEGRMIFAVKGKGAFVMDEHGNIRKIQIAHREQLDKNNRLRVDDGFESGLDLEKLKDYYGAALYDLCTAAHYIDFALGNVDGLIEATRKGNLEIGALYGLVTELGGVMGTVEEKRFEDIGNRHFRTFGQERETHLPIISAVSHELAQEICKVAA